MLIDTHSHVNFNAYKNDADKVIRRSLDSGTWMINVGSNYETSKRAVEIAEGVYPHTKFGVGVYAAIGLHPIHLADGIFKTKMDEEEIAFHTREESFDPEKYRDLALRHGSGQAKPKVVAIGEIGLDYYYKPKTKIKLEQFKIKQKEVFLQQLELAKELNLPVILHCRSAHEELIDILNTKYKMLNTRGVVHCFTGTLEDAKKYVEMGFYLGLNGIIFKLDLDETIRKITLDKILLETDCPYLTPYPMEGRNEPLYVKYVAERVAKLKNLGVEELEKITTENARKLFKV